MLGLGWDGGYGQGCFFDQMHQCGLRVQQNVTRRGGSKTVVVVVVVVVAVVVVVVVVGGGGRQALAHRWSPDLYVRIIGRQAGSPSPTQVLDHLVDALKCLQA